ncbi:Uncharacterized protein HZ326_22717 [Fusarium oxysporum f. sp. albedinis]|nr:Uncharacterized protein HZ326_22717 [Fusarium oxysporum f. sp. albedinis]
MPITYPQTFNGIKPQSTKSPAVIDIKDNFNKESINKGRHYKDYTLSRYKSSATTESKDSKDNYIDNREREYKDNRALKRDKIKNYNRESSAMGALGGKTPPFIKEILKLLFRLIIELSTEEIIDSYPASTLLVYFSRILRFSTDLNGFLPAKVIHASPCSTDIYSTPSIPRVCPASIRLSFP